MMCEFQIEVWLDDVWVLSSKQDVAVTHPDILMCVCVELGEAMAAPSDFHAYVQALLRSDDYSDVVQSDDMDSAELLPHNGVVFLTGFAAGNQKLVHRITHEIVPLPGNIWLCMYM